MTPVPDKTWGMRRTWDGMVTGDQLEWHEFKH